MGFSDTSGIKISSAEIGRAKKAKKLFEFSANLEPQNIPRKPNTWPIAVNISQ